MILGATPDDRLRPRGLLAETQSLGWGVLADVPGREIVVGAVTRPWEANVTFRALPPDQFAAFSEPGYVKIVWTLRAEPISPTESLFRTETRAIATDHAARAKFRRYWSFLSPGIIVIRWAMLGPLKSEAERRARQCAPPELLTVALLLVMVMQAALGLLVPAQYRDVDWIRASWSGNDWVTLVVAVPLLLQGLVGTVRRRARGLLVWLGLIGYALYNYAFYLFGAALNAFFPIYVLAFVLAVIVLILALSHLDADEVAATFQQTVPVRVIGGSLIVHRNRAWRRCGW